MTVYALLKFAHVLAAIVAVGSNLTYAFWLRRARGDQTRLVDAIQGVRRLDRTIANPAYIVLLITGIATVMTGGWRFEQGWIAAGLGLYVVVAILGITLYAPTIRRQLAEAERDPSSAEYTAVERRSTTLGLVTTGIVVVIVFLMVTKPF